MKYKCKLTINILEATTLYIPVSRDAQNLKISINGKKCRDNKTFEYGVANNKGIELAVEKSDDVVVTYYVNDNPSQPVVDSGICLSNDERYTKWKENGFVSSFVKEHSELELNDYIQLAANYIKDNVDYAGYSTGTVAQKYEYTDEIIGEKKSVDCLGFHSLLVSLLRARKIPAILDIGFRLGSGDNPHIWAWYWDKKWIRIDLLDDIKPQIGDNPAFPRVSVGLGTTHNFNRIPGNSYTISYMQYALTESLIAKGTRSSSAVFDSFISKSLSKRFMLKLLHGLFSYSDFLYLLQLEDYLNDRYLRTVKRFLFRREVQQRDTLKVTSKIEFIKTIAILLQIFSLFLAFLAMYAISGNLTFSIICALFLIPVVLFLIPFFVLAANTIAYPLYSSFRSLIIKKATKKIEKLKNLKIIMISGSYGKTSVKNFLYQLISPMYRTQMTAGNINTHTGIASWINNSLLENTEFLITEVDGFHEGEIRDIAHMIPADIVIITYLGDQHLERLGSKEILAKTLKETVDFSKPNSQVFIAKQTLEAIEKEGVKIAGREMNIVKFGDEVMKYNSELSQTNAQNVQYAFEVAKYLNVPNDLMEDAIAKISLPDRRQKISNINGFTVVDDSYNISLNTAKESLKRGLELAQKEHMKLLVVFAGIAELGNENKNANREYAKNLVDSADFVVLLNSIFREEVEGVFKEKGFTHYKVVPTMQEAVLLYQRLFNHNEYLIVWHPELTDLYY